MERGAEFFFTSFTRQASLIEEPLDFCVWKRNKGEAWDRSLASPSDAVHKLPGVGKSLVSLPHESDT